MGQAGQRPLANDFGLEHHLPQQLPNARSDGAQGKIRIRFGGADSSQNRGKAVPKSRKGGRQQYGEHYFLGR